MRHTADRRLRNQLNHFPAVASLRRPRIQRIQTMSPFVAEIIGTMLLVLLGDGVVANVLLRQSKGNGGGWIVITAGWGFGVMVGAYAVGQISGAHLNPAVTIAFAAANINGFG